MNLRLTLLGTILIGALNGGSHGGGGNPPATVSFNDTPGNLIHSDGAGAYYNGVSGVVADFVANGNVQLNLASSTRTVYLDFSSPVGTPSLTPASGYYHVDLSNNVVSADGSCSSGTGLLGMPNNTTAKTCLWANFTDSLGRSWAIRFDSYNYPGSTDATVTSTDGTYWTIQAAPTDVGVLILIGKKSQSVEGYFNMPGTLTIGKQ